MLCPLIFALPNNGKPHKVAMITVANKLIKQAFAIVKKGTKYEVLEDISKI
jgi:hypothetical protein